jgi:hypothetical protein
VKFHLAVKEEKLVCPDEYHAYVQRAGLIRLRPTATEEDVMLFSGCREFAMHLFVLANTIGSWRCGLGSSHAVRCCTGSYYAFEWCVLSAVKSGHSPAKYGGRRDVLHDSATRLRMPGQRLCGRNWSGWFTPKENTGIMLTNDMVMTESPHEELATDW